MRLGDHDRFAASSVDGFYRLTGAAMLSAIASEAVAGAHLVHAGKLFPYRHLPGVPLYGVPFLVLEWSLTAASGLSLMLGIRLALTVRLALVVAIVGLSQRYSNHRALLVIVLAFTALDPPDPRTPPLEADFEEVPRPNLVLVRLELVIVYWASADNKLAHGFASGETLTTVLGISPALARPLALATIALEVLLPVLSFTRPRLAVACIATMHLAFAVVLPATWSFGFLMVAMAVLGIRGPTADSPRFSRST